jgi:hypothetical protein
MTIKEKTLNVDQKFVHFLEILLVYPIQSLTCIKTDTTHD